MTMLFFKKKKEEPVLQPVFEETESGKQISDIDDELEDWEVWDDDDDDDDD